MYQAACRHSDDVIFCFDSVGNKYVATGGNLAWRINNPGLVHSRSRFSRKFGAIGSCGRYAIFPRADEGHKALEAWIHSKRLYNSLIKSIAKSYQPNNAESYVKQLSSLSGISPEIRIKKLKLQELERFLISIEKLCGYVLIGNEMFSLLPKVVAKIENGKDKENSYIIGDNTVLSQREAVDWVQSHRLDAVIVHERSGAVHLRSRPKHCIWTISTHKPFLFPPETKIDTLVRVTGMYKTGQCTWAFINGIDNSKEEALASAELISKTAGGERVLYMPNDTIWAPLDLLACFILKTSLDTPVIKWTVKFLRYLLAISKQATDSPLVVVFVHSQGAILIEHAVEVLNQDEKKQLRIFTFGGGSFLAPGKCHSDSHNYASAADFVCRFGSPNLQLLALERYHGHKNGLNDEEIIDQLANRDAVLHLDSTNLTMFEHYVKQRIKYYQGEFVKISNLTILDPDSDSKWKHAFSSECYQKTIQEVINKYQYRIKEEQS